MSGWPLTVAGTDSAAASEMAPRMPLHAIASRSRQSSPKRVNGRNTTTSRTTATTSASASAVSSSVPNESPARASSTIAGNCRPSSRNSSALRPKTSTSQNALALNRVSALKVSCENQPR